MGKETDRPARARNKKVSEKDKETLLEALRRGVTFRQASEMACHNPATWTAYRKRHPEFNEACKEAMEIGTDVLEQEAFRRGVEGILKPIIGKVAPGIDGQLRDEEGNLMYERVYSDRTLEVLLKGRRPEYRDNPRVDITNQTLNVAIEDRSAALSAVAKVLQDAGAITIEASEGTNGGGASFKELPES